MSWVVDSPELVAVHLLSFICHPWCSSCSMDNHNNQSPGLQLLIITVHSSKNLIILHYNGTVRLLIRHIWQNFFLVKNLLEWFLSLFISISWCPTVLLIITLLHCNKLVYHTKYFSAMHKVFFLRTWRCCCELLSSKPSQLYQWWRQLGLATHTLWLSRDA